MHGHLAPSISLSLRSLPTPTLSCSGEVLSRFKKAIFQLGLIHIAGGATVSSPSCHKGSLRQAHAGKLPCNIRPLYFVSDSLLGVL